MSLFDDINARADAAKARQRAEADARGQWWREVDWRVVLDAFADEVYRPVEVEVFGALFAVSKHMRAVGLVYRWSTPEQALSALQDAHDETPVLERMTQTWQTQQAEHPSRRIPRRMFHVPLRVLHAERGEVVERFDLDGDGVVDDYVVRRAS